MDSPLLRNSIEKRNQNSSQLPSAMSIAGPKNGGVCHLRMAMLQSVPRCSAGPDRASFRRVSPRSFPHLWKKLWKSRGEGHFEPVTTLQKLQLDCREARERAP